VVLNVGRECGKEKKKEGCLLLIISEGTQAGRREGGKKGLEYFGEFAQ